MPVIARFDSLTSARGAHYGQIRRPERIRQTRHSRLLENEGGPARRSSQASAWAICVDGQRHDFRIGNERRTMKPATSRRSPAGSSTKAIFR